MICSKIANNFAIFLALLFVVPEHVWAQSGYNYVRPEVTNIPAAVTTNAVRPVGGFPTVVGGGSSTAGGVYPTAAGTAFGGGNANVSPTATAYGSAYGPGGAAAQLGGTNVGYSPAAAAAGFAGTTAGGGLAKRPSTLAQRTGGGSIYGTNTGGIAQTQYSSSGRGTGTGSGLDADYDGDYSAIPGEPGVSYPVYSQVPATNFDCALQGLPGYYADVEAQCQVFHICALNRTYSFLCPNGTIFSQETLVCVWWNQFDCGIAPSLYANNAYIYDYGSSGAPTNQAGLAGTGLRQQTNFAAPSSTRAPLATGTSIYGAGNIRPTVTGTNFQGTAITPVPNVGFPQTNIAVQGSQTNTAAGRFNAAPTAATQTFPATPAPYGAVIRSGGGAVSPTTNIGGGGGGAAGRSEAAYQTSQLATSSNNREYLPPRRP